MPPNEAERNSKALRLLAELDKRIQADPAHKGKIVQEYYTELFESGDEEGAHLVLLVRAMVVANPSQLVGEHALAPASPHNPQPAGSGNGKAGPHAILKEAIVAVPAVKYALGVAGILAAVAIGTSFFKSARIGFVGAAVMMVFMVLLLVFAAATKLGPDFLHAPAKFLTWSMIVLFVGTCFMTMLFVFSGHPQAFGSFMAAFFPGFYQGVPATGGSNAPKDKENATTSKEPPSGPKEHPKTSSGKSNAMAAFVGVWRSTRMNDDCSPPLYPSCKRSCIRQFILRVVETTPGKYFADAEDTKVQNGPVTGQCPSVLESPQENWPISATILGVTADTITLQMAEGGTHFVGKFRLAKSKLVMVNGFETFLNDKNRDSLGVHSLEFTK